MLENDASPGSHAGQDLPKERVITEVIQRDVLHTAHAARGVAQGGISPRRSRLAAFRRAVVVGAVLLVGGITSAWTFQARARDAAELATCLKRGLPYPGLTPGDRDPAAPGAPEVPPETARGVLASYGVQADADRYVVCRLIPHTLGGTNRPENLFPTTRWFADLKARLDSRMTTEVNAGRLSFDQAERELKTNWIAAVHKYYVRNYGETDQERARQIEDTLHW